MTVGESCDVNTVLYYLLAIERPSVGPVSPEDALRAAERLAGRANRTLMAGLTPARVAAAWPMPGRRRKGVPE